VEIFLIVLCAVLFLLAIVAFSPVVLAVDSRTRQVRICWLFVLEFQMPLPGTAGQKLLTAFGKPYPIREEHHAAKAPRAEKPAKTPRPRRKRQAVGRFFMRSLGDSDIRRAMARQLSLVLRRILRSATVTRSEANISTPDPALNGMLAGALAASNWGNRPGVRINFTGQNSLFMELRFHPHRLFKAFLFFLPGLPYRAMLRQWRALSAAHSIHP
jgi:hypothetical protein